MSKCKPLPPKEVLDRWFVLDLETGRLFWKEKPSNRTYAGKEAGTCARLTSGKRWMIAVPGYKNRFYRYRIVWKMVYGLDPSNAVDHWDKNTLNDSPKNLIDGGKSWNGRNKIITAKSGIRGVIFINNRWRVSFTYQGKSVYVGTFDSAEEAATAYEERRMALCPSHPATV